MNSEYRFDIFISHAWEDKDTVAMPLALALQARGRTAWIDKSELQLGDRLRQKIEEGLAQSRFGVVILSVSFFAKQWPTLDLDGLATRENDEKRKVILPVRHRLRHEDVIKHSILLGGIVSVSTDEGIPAVADMIVRVLKHEEEADASSPTNAIPSTTKDGPPKKSADETDFTTGRPEVELTDQSAPDSKQLIEGVASSPLEEELEEEEEAQSPEAPKDRPNKIGAALRVFFFTLFFGSILAGISYCGYGVYRRFVPTEAQNETSLGWDLVNDEDKTKVQMAFAHFTKALSLDPGLDSAIIGLGVYYYNKEKDEDDKKAEALFRHALGVNPRSGLAKLWLARLQVRRKNFEGALNLYTEAAADGKPEIALKEKIEILMNQIDLHWSEVSERSRLANQAIEDITRLLRFTPNDPLLYTYRSSAYAALGRKAESDADYNKS